MIFQPLRGWLISLVPSAHKKSASVAEGRLMFSGRALPQFL
jgi:hypothetical protein